MCSRLKRICFFTLFICSCLLFSCARPPVEPPPDGEEPPAKPGEPSFVEVGWEEVPGWADQNFIKAFNTFRDSCRALKGKPDWQEVCREERLAEVTTRTRAQAFFEAHFRPYKVFNADGSDVGLMTGYYVPDLEGSRIPTERFRYPLYGEPSDLLTIDLTSIYPELRGMRLKGRIQGKKVVPYWDRAAIDGSGKPLKGGEIFWVDDVVELFFLHIQGSGRINLPNGEQVYVGYANQNGYPYRSIGRVLLEKGAMSLHEMSMQNIRAWAKAHPDEVEEVLNANPSYVFFTELDVTWAVPPGSLGIPLTPRYSLAVDPLIIPLGSPVFIETTWPGTNDALQRLMLAQDTGGAIKGPVRGDFFWGVGDTAGSFAGRMKQDARFWVLRPEIDGER